MDGCAQLDGCACSSLSLIMSKPLRCTVIACTVACNVTTPGGGDRVGEGGGGYGDCTFFPVELIFHLSLFPLDFYTAFSVFLLKYYFGVQIWTFFHWTFFKISPSLF